MRTTGLVCLVLCVQTAVPQNVGWKGYLTENPTEFHDLPLSWEQDTPVPSWLSGTYVRNGPSQVTLSTFTSCLQFLCPDQFWQPKESSHQLVRWICQAAKLQDVWQQHPLQVTQLKKGDSKFTHYYSRGLWQCPQHTTYFKSYYL